ncbi:DUF2461 domain-containing protein [Arenibacter sp. GZD96]|uniref:DUF2461 domain-containing protein n=1 Tax=Aurantibrevibacter litoralis TaxID=3106030 RepID=UPI002AFED696|nr:DUF2461 domain-containing protein [Arenibacter sp. GZD-96]MEA1785320.1 DUF2461 domain-containing protein [Arenibacter sp. GZD-96]
MQRAVLTKNIFNFLKALENNNNKEWFLAHKDTFTQVEKEVRTYYTAIMDDLKHHDDIEKVKLFRIYRDVRFSKDKTPYKTHFGGSFSRRGARLRGGYYLHLKPGNSFIATGFWEPNKDDLFRIRKEFESDASHFNEICQQRYFQEIWGTLQGDEVKTAPKGFHKEHPNIGLIRKKQFIFVRNFKDTEVLSPTFSTQIDESFKAIRPYFDLMSDILTTNLNGESLLD